MQRSHFLSNININMNFLNYKFNSSLHLLKLVDQTRVMCYVYYKLRQVVITNYDSFITDHNKVYCTLQQLKNVIDLLTKVYK